MRSILIFILLSLSYQSKAQTLVNQWDFTYGGTDIDLAEDFIKTCDGGYLIGGTTVSPADCTITQTPRGFRDYWIIKLDANGFYKWDKRFGGNNTDILKAVINSNDGGYILTGFSDSNNNFDKTEPNFDSTESTGDIWVIKIDSLGNKIWDKTFGGIKNDVANDICSANGSGYIICGASASPVSGNKTVAPFDSLGDCWVIKIDENGNIIWQKVYGGTNYDNAVYITKNNFNGYFIVSASASNAGGNKSENNFDTSFLTGDLWVIKVDNNGNIIWDKTIGGNNTDNPGGIISSPNGDLYVTSHSWSGVSGNKIAPNHSSSADFWLVKLDINGNIIWDKTYGTNDQDDGLCRGHLTSDNKIIITGNSQSMLPNGDKSQPNLTSGQTWVICVDNNGNKVWDKTIQQNFLLGGGGWPTQSTGTLESSDHCFITANWTDAGIGGDKTQLAKGNFDFFIMKYCDVDLVNNYPVEICKDEFSTNMPLTNIFTPNGDGINDILIFQNLPEQSQILIYNRWGNLMYEQTNYQNNWKADGISEGVYFYVLKLPSGESKKGTLQIFK